MPQSVTKVRSCVNRRSAAREIAARTFAALLPLLMAAASPVFGESADREVILPSSHGGKRTADVTNKLLFHAPSSTPNYHRDVGPYYNPQLPPKVYFDKEQEQLAKTLSADVSTYIYFVDPKDGHKKEFEQGNHGTKSWTTEEKNDVMRMFSTLYGIAPGLIVRAASGRKLGLHRTTTIDGLHGRSSAASAGVQTINVGDSFFHTPYQFHGLVHELVHEADWDGRVAYSKEWVDFAAPRTYKHKIEAGLLSEPELRQLDHLLRQGEDWPTLYGCENFKEALAEYCSASIADSDFIPDPIFAKILVPKILVPLPNEIEFGALFKQGRTSYLNDKYQDAITVLEKCTALDPSVADGHVELAACYVRQNEYKKALVEMDIAEQAMNKAGVRSTEPDMLYLLRWKATLYHKQGDDDLAIAEMNKILLNQPPSADDVYKRFWLEEKKGLLAEAVLDFYHWKEPIPKSEYLPASELDAQYSQSLLDKEVARFPKLGIVLRRRGRFFESLASGQVDDDSRSVFYKKALVDFQNSIGMSDCDEVEGLFGCGELSCKLKDFTNARECLKKIEDLDKDSLASQSLNVIILSGEGRNADARVIFEKIHSRLFAKPSKPSKQRINDDSVNGLSWRTIDSRIRSGS